MQNKIATPASFISNEVLKMLHFLYTQSVDEIDKQNSNDKTSENIVGSHVIEIILKICFLLLSLNGFMRKLKY